MKTVVVGLILAFLLFTPQGQGIGFLTMVTAIDALGLDHTPPFGTPVTASPLTPEQRFRQLQLQHHSP
jgi:hypothetical protein